MLKVFLNVSNEEQRKRLQERVDDPEKRWKFRRDDLKVYERFGEWLFGMGRGAHGDVDRVGSLARRPADRNWVKALAVAELLAAVLEQLDPRLPGEAGLEGLRIA